MCAIELCAFDADRTVLAISSKRPSTMAAGRCRRRSEQRSVYAGGRRWICWPWCVLAGRWIDITANNGVAPYSISRSIDLAHSAAWVSEPWVIRSAPCAVYLPPGVSTLPLRRFPARRLGLGQSGPSLPAVPCRHGRYS